VILVDGKARKSLPATDRGLHYGDGVFTTLAVRDGKACWLDAHLERLRAGCHRLGIPAPEEVVLRRDVEAVLEGEGNAVVKLIITRGSGGRGYAPPEPVTPRRIALRYPLPDHPLAYAEQGVRLRIADARLAINPRLAGIKHLNRLEQVLARAEWDASATDIPEALMLDAKGRLIEGTMTNLFVAAEGVLMTPDLRECGVEGVMRRVIIDEVQAQGMAIQIQELYPDILATVDELFVANSVNGIWPVIACGEYRYHPGRLTRRLQQATGLCD
jgi:4-amino-4-deoxychorismate lyase